MDTKLGELYESIYNKETNPLTEETVGKDIKGDLEGAEKAKTKPDTNKNVKVDKPTEGPSSDNEDGKPKELKGKATKAKESSSEETVKLSFDDLYNKTINEEGELDDQVVPAPDVEGSEFDTDTGDFGEGDMSDKTDTDEEVDLATELGMIADRLTEIKDKLMGVESTENPDEDLGDTGDLGDTEGVEGEDTLGTEDVTKESAKITEAIKSEPSPKPLKKTTLGPKTKQVPSNKIGTSGKGTTVSKVASKDYSGKPSNASKTTLGPKMSQTVTGKGPTVAGKGETFIK